MGSTPESEPAALRIAAGTRRRPGVAAAQAWVPWLRWLGVVGTADLVLLLASVQSPALTMSPLLAYAIGFATVAGLTIATALACPPAGVRTLPLLLLPALSLVAVSVGGRADLRTAVVVTAALLLASSLLGAVVGRAVEHPGHLVFVALVSSAADVFSVFHESGPSHAVVQSELALSVLALPWPMLGTPNIEPFLGAGDIVFTAIYAGVARRHGLPMGRTLLALAAGFLLTMLAVLAFQVTLPALPFLGLTMVLAHPAARRPPAADRARGWLVCGVVFFAVAAMFLF